MDSKVLVIELYRALKKAGVKNRVERVRVIARQLGASFSNGDAARWLEPFLSGDGAAVRADQGRFSGRKPGRTADGTADGKRRGKRTEPRTENGRNDDRARVHEGARASLDLFNSLEADVDGANAPSAQERGWAMRDALAAVVRPHLTAMTITRWRQINSKAAQDLAAVGVTPESAVAFWQDEYDRTGHPIIKLTTLQEHMSAAASRQVPEARVVPSISQLRAEGKIPPRPGTEEPR